MERVRGGEEEGKRETNKSSRKVERAGERMREREKYGKRRRGEDERKGEEG